MKTSGGCATAKIKSLSPASALGAFMRAAAVADALRETVGGQAMIRRANGAWEVDQAREAIPAVARPRALFPLNTSSGPA